MPGVGRGGSSQPQVKRTVTFSRWTHSQPGAAWQKGSRENKYPGLTRSVSLPNSVGTSHWPTPAGSWSRGRLVRQSTQASLLGHRAEQRRAGRTESTWHVRPSRRVPENGLPAEGFAGPGLRTPPSPLPPQCKPAARPNLGQHRERSASPLPGRSRVIPGRRENPRSPSSPCPTVRPAVPAICGVRASPCATDPSLRIPE